MKLKTLLACLALLLYTSASGFEGEKANLSGTWTLDKARASATALNSIRQ